MGVLTPRARSRPVPRSRRTSVQEPLGRPTNDHHGAHTPGQAVPSKQHPKEAHGADEGDTGGGPAEQRQRRQSRGSNRNTVSDQEEEARHKHRLVDDWPVQCREESSDTETGRCHRPAHRLPPGSLLAEPRHTACGDDDPLFVAGRVCEPSRSIRPPSDDPRATCSLAEGHHAPAKAIRAP
ncbi:hypothetical protein CBS101457_000100 [Exobasidium rhododendri]|nr:hypothetical protein CBS101457_000100 [Exobasidium rhododendri]